MVSASDVLARVDRLQRAHTPTAFVVGVVRKYGDDRASRLAAVIAYYSFFSVFPAILALVTILGFVLEGNDSLRDSIQTSALAQMPVIGDFVGEAATKPLTGNTTALVLGLATALWAGMGAMQAAQDAINTMWEVPRDEQPSFLKKRGRSLLMLVTIGALLIGSAVATQLVNHIGDLAVVTQVLLFVVTLGLNCLTLLVAFQLLLVEWRPWRVLLPGAIVAGVGYQLLQLVGQLYVDRVLRGAQDVYGTFATVIGLLSWLYLLAHNLLIGVEVNVVAAKKLWPRHVTRGLEVAAATALISAT